MSKRQRRKREKVRRHEPRERPDRLALQLATGAGATVGATLLMGGVAQAACTCTVDSLADPTDPGHTTLRNAITSANANPGSTITFTSGLSGTITLGGSELLIYALTTISGPGASQLTVSGNHASRVFEVSGTAAKISGLTITAGRVAGLPPFTNSGGGIYGGVSDLTVRDSVVADSDADDAGGGIAVRGGGSSLTVASTTISGNTASGDFGGGGVYTQIGAGIPTTIRNSTISGNSTFGAYTGGGGAFFDSSAPATVENSTIYGNDAGYYGGGLNHNGFSAPGLTVTGSTITHNSADRGGGIACYGASFGGNTLTEPVLRDTIVFGNIAASLDQGPDVSCDHNANPALAGTVPAGFSLLGSVDTGTTIEQTPPGSDIFGQDPYLGPLANNGGPTQTQLPANNSPLVNKGRAFGLTTDQRGLTRPVAFPGVPNSSAAGADGSDIGAIELQSAAPPRCKGKPASIAGTNGNDVRKGTSGKDVIVGLGGNDKLSGLAGNDLICGGAGKDTLKGGKGNDKLYGEAGKDTLKGGPGKDKLKGGAGKDKQIQ